MDIVNLECLSLISNVCTCKLILSLQGMAITGYPLTVDLCKMLDSEIHKSSVILTNVGGGQIEEREGMAGIGLRFCTANLHIWSTCVVLETKGSARIEAKVQIV